MAFAHVILRRLRQSPETPWRNCLVTLAKTSTVGVVASPTTGTLELQPTVYYSILKRDRCRLAKA